MKILVVGGGGREHAIIKSLKKNPSITAEYSNNDGWGAVTDC